MGAIVVGVDGSANSAAALRWAVAEADLRQHHVTALYAWGHVPPSHAGGGHSFDAEYGPPDADAALAAVIDGAVGPDEAAGIERRVVYDHASTSLLAAAEGADLLVLGARGVGGFRGLLLGSVSQQCLHHATGPVAIVRLPESPGAPAEPGVASRGSARRRIVVGVDASDSAHRALRWALEEARLRQAGVDVVHAWQPPYPVHTPLAGIPIGAEIIEKHARSVLDRVVDGEDTRHQPEPVERILVCGGAARAVLDTAPGADLVVLGSRGVGGFTGLLLGSVTHHVAHHLRCPLAVIP